MNLGWLDAVALAPALERAVAADRVAQAGAVATVAATLLGRPTRHWPRTTSAGAVPLEWPCGRPDSTWRWAARTTDVRLHARNAAVRLLAIPPANQVLARAFTMRWL